jgi:hypothetical protein
MNICNSPTGFWLVKDADHQYKTFYLKYDALTYASSSKKELGFYFYNPIWENFDKNQLGKCRLVDLYAQRAQQLRDKYDYLVLHYSGGSDSHNILHTFLINNIKLDEISIRWPKHWIDGKFYTPNNLDRSAKNAPSEFDYTIKPALKYIQTYYPDIKINIVDYTENLNSATESKLTNRIISINSSRGALGSIAQRLDPGTDRKMSSASGNKVGHIFGIEKPLLYHQDNRLYFYFSDVSFDTIRMENEFNVEPFYWTADLPLLHMEQAYQVGMFFKTNPQYLNLLPGPGKSVHQVTNEISMYQNLLKSILYKDSWDTTKFQVDKPNVDRSDWHAWIHQAPELNKLNVLFKNVMNELTAPIEKKYLVDTPTATLFAPRRTQLFHLIDLAA